MTSYCQCKRGHMLTSKCISLKGINNEKTVKKKKEGGGVGEVGEREGREETKGRRRGTNFKRPHRRKENLMFRCCSSESLELVGYHCFSQVKLILYCNMEIYYSQLDKKKK